jgi:hypothetical protein
MGISVALAASIACAPIQWTGRRGDVRVVSRCEADRAVVDFDLDDGLAVSEQVAFTGLVDGGIGNLERLLAPSLPRERRRDRRIRFVVSRRVAMSRTYGTTVLLPLTRVRERRAPYLHEAVHALLPSAHRSTWLSEGLACYLESWIAENVGGYDAHVFTRAGDRGIHRAAARYLETDAGRAVLPWVGIPGAPPGLFEDRALVARPFYVLSHSFTKHLVEKLGLEAVAELASTPDPEGELARVSGRAAPRWLEEWRSGLRTSSGRSPWRGRSG